MGSWNPFDEPDPPDPYAVAQAQAQANRDTAGFEANLNRFNINTPYGAETWTQPAVEGDPWTQTQTLDPRAQALLDSNLSLQGGLTGAQQSALGNVQSTFATPLDFSGVSAAPNIAENADAIAGAFSSADPRTDISATRNLAAGSRDIMGDQLSRLANTYSQDFNYSGAPAMPTADTATRDRIADALYGRATSRLDPRYQQRESDLTAQLAAQGITQGSEAYNREVQNLSMDRNDAYAQALTDSIIGSGNEMANQFGMGLSARQQGVEEADTLRQAPTVEAAAMQALLSGNNSDLLGFYGQEGANNVNISNITGALTNTQSNLRQNGINETILRRITPLNEFSALMTGTQVQPPQFTQQQVGTNVAQTPLASSVYGSAGLEQDGWRTTSGNVMQTLFGPNGNRRQ